MQPQQQYPYFFLLLLIAHIAICVVSHKSLQQSFTPVTQQLLSNQNMSTASLHHHQQQQQHHHQQQQHHHHQQQQHHHLRRHYRAPCAVVKEEDPADLESDASPMASASRKEFHLSADCCDCGMLTGCRCSDPICDMVCERVDESEMEEGMDDQGYRQHV